MTLTPREKLIIMYRESNRSQRLAIAKNLGFTGKPVNRLRSLRRLIRTDITQTQKFNVTSYFKPFVTQENYDTMWEGETPPLNLQGSFSIRSTGIGVFKFEQDRNELIKLFQPSGDRKTYTSDNMRTLFQSYQEGINRLFENPPRAYETIGVSFNKRGFRGLIEYAEDKTGDEFRAPLRLEGVGIFIIPAKARIVGKKSVPYTPVRPFPKRRRKERERYINRAFGALSGKGGRLSEFKPLD